MERTRLRLCAGGRLHNLLVAGGSYAAVSGRAPSSKARVLDEAGFTGTGVDVLPWTAEGPMHRGHAAGHGSAAGLSEFTPAAPAGPSCRGPVAPVGLRRPLVFPKPQHPPQARQLPKSYPTAGGAARRTSAENRRRPVGQPGAGHLIRSPMANVRVRPPTSRRSCGHSSAQRYRAKKSNSASEIRRGASR